MDKKRLYLLFFLLLVCILSGCGTRTVGEMYSLPRRSSEYTNLQTVIDAAMSELSYAAPVAGENRQSVQMADLDGDGRDEIIVFAKGVSENPLQILVFRQTSEDKYEHMETIPCRGGSFEQVQYLDVDDKPGCEMIVGRRINDQVNRIASIYSFASGQSEQMIGTIYTRYTTCDLDSNGRSELLVIRNGEDASSNAVAVLYSYRQGEIVRSVEASLSEKSDQIKRITLGKLSDGVPAVYIASTYDDVAVTTDIFTLKSDVFTNISFSSEWGTSVQTMRNYYVYAEDIDADGVLELPSLIPMRYMAENPNREEQNLIRWYSVDKNCEETDKMFTFHNFAAGWYVELGSSWISRVAVVEEGDSCTFYMWNENYGEAMAVFTIYSLTGRERDSQAATQNRFALYRGENVVYAGKLEAASAIYGITEDYLVKYFHLIRQDRKTGEI